MAEEKEDYTGPHKIEHEILTKKLTGNLKQLLA